MSGNKNWDGNVEPKRGKIEGREKEGTLVC
jgi:hypothetical protein